MLCLVYDGSYDGFLSAVFAAFAGKGREVTLCNRMLTEPPALFDTKVICTDREKVRRVVAGMARLGSEVEDTLYRAWLSELPGTDDDILECLKIGFAEKKDPTPMRYHECVRRVTDCAHRVGFEAHRFLGYIRFRVLSDSFLVSDIEPDHNILPLIGNHFHQRFGSQKLIIRDLKRRRAVVSDPRGWYVAELTEAELAPLTGGDRYEELWKSYFIHIANQQRKNLKLQQHFVPKKYRAHITEFHQE